MNPLHHPSESWLIGYAAGSIGEGASLVVASHLNFCSRCHGIVTAAEAVGGALLDDLLPVEMTMAIPDLATLQQPAPDLAAPPAPTARDGNLLPAPLAPYVGRRIDDISWKRITKGLWQAELLTDSKGSTARLYRISPGRAMPEHGHLGEELSMVLTGAYHDEFGRFGAGDVAELDYEVIHRPVAEDVGECIALTVNESPIRLTSWVGRMFAAILH